MLDVSKRVGLSHSLVWVLLNWPGVDHDIDCIICIIARIDGSFMVKIADFGMSRDVYEKDYYTMDNMNKPLPMKWMAVESLKEGRYTSKSDVVRCYTIHCHL